MMTVVVYTPITGMQRMMLVEYSVLNERERERKTVKRMGVYLGFIYILFFCFFNSGCSQQHFVS
ncbi:hypothetical protein Hanom_Chr09g00834201 [Helianthus anomalus]